MILSHRKRIYIISGTLFLLYMIFYIVSCAPLTGQRKFVRKTCVECHTEFVNKYLSMKNVHAVVKGGKCEECHLRHGLVPRLLMKGIGNETSYACLNKKQNGMHESR